MVHYCEGWEYMYVKLYFEAIKLVRSGSLEGVSFKWDFGQNDAVEDITILI